MAKVEKYKVLKSFRYKGQPVEKGGEPFETDDIDAARYLTNIGRIEAIDEALDEELSTDDQNVKKGRPSAAQKKAAKKAGEKSGPETTDGDPETTDGDPEDLETK